MRGPIESALVLFYLLLHHGFAVIIGIAVFLFFLLSTYYDGERCLEL